MSELVKALKLAIATDHFYFIEDDLSEEQALNIAADLNKLGRKPTDGEVYEIIKKYYSGKLLSAAFESRDQARTNALQMAVLKMIQANKK